MTAMTRRNVLTVGGLGAGITAVGLTVPLGQSVSTADWISTGPKPARFARPLPVPTPLAPTVMTDEYGEYHLYEITEQATSAQLLDPGGPLTAVFGYGGMGDGPSVPGPVIKVDQNTRVRMRVHNELPPVHPTFGYRVETSVHLHGSASLPQFDGYADDVTRPGHYKDYWFPNHQGPRTLWYHDHAVHRTAQNVYSGLVAQYHLHNEWERENLPQEQYDVPLTISDAIFAKDGSLAYMDRDHSGLYGDVIMVNGVPWPYLEVERRFYRFRILMATLSRSMKLFFVNTRTGARLPTYVVATDGGVTIPQRVGRWRHAGAERYEVMVDFGDTRVGDKIELRNASNKNNRNFRFTRKVMQFRVTAEASDLRWNEVPTPPASELHSVMSRTRRDSRRTRNIDLEHDDVTNLFLINGMGWEDVQRSNWNIFADGGSPPRPGDVEVWRIENKSGGWFHPLHIHLVDFKIIRRRGGANRVQPWERGPKDVVYVGEGEIVDVLVQYNMPPAAYPDGRSTGQAGGSQGELGGRYMIHCHNLAHEDHDMMHQFFVAASDGSEDLSETHPNHPIHAAPPE